MFQAIEVKTPRLLLRQWRETDREPFAAMNADPAVMEFFQSTQSRALSDASIDAWRSQFARQGWSNWAVELRSSGEFIGFRPPLRLHCLYRITRTQWEARAA